jgi:predicted ATPase with chaperone activity
VASTSKRTSRVALKRFTSTPVGATGTTTRSATEAAAIGGVEVYGMRSLREAVEFLGDCARAAPAEPAVEDGQSIDAAEDFADVAGQRYAKRALEVAVAGGTTSS